MKGMCRDEETCADVERLLDFSLCTSFVECLNWKLVTGGNSFSFSERLDSRFYDPSCSENDDDESEMESW